MHVQAFVPCCQAVAVTAFLTRVMFCIISVRVSQRSVARSVVCIRLASVTCCATASHQLCRLPVLTSTTLQMRASWNPRRDCCVVLQANAQHTTITNTNVHKQHTATATSCTLQLRHGKGGKPHCWGSNCSKLLSTAAAPKSAIKSLFRLGSGTMTACMPPATPACMPDGASSKTSTVSGEAGG